MIIQSHAIRVYKPNEMELVKTDTCKLSRISVHTEIALIIVTYCTSLVLYHLYSVS